MRVNRDIFFDSMRGIAIIAVVAIHAIYLGGTPDSPGFLCYRQLLNFSVPVFFFMSGYWASKKQISSIKDYKSFLTKKFFRIVVPYLFWSFVLLGYSALAKAHFGAFEIIFKLSTGGACMGYYFVIAIIQLYLLTPLLQYLNRRLKWYGFMLVLAFNFAIIFVLYLSRLFHVIGHLPVALPFYFWVIYYEMGLFSGAGLGDFPVSPKMRAYILFAIPVSGLISVLEGHILSTHYNSPDFAAFAVKYSTFIYSVFVILGFLLWKQYFRRLPRVLIVLGRYSFGIYLIHVVVLGWVVMLFQKSSLLRSFQPAYQLVLVATTTGICFVLISAARKLLPESVCVKVLGF